MDGKTELKVRNFNCPQCGGPQVVRGMQQTTSMVCDGCGTIIDLSDENFKILDAFTSRVKHTPLIPLGATGTLRGEKWQVLGFMRRCITVEGVGYRWSEYLLFNPYRGFRWLTEYNGHWNYVRQCIERPHGLAGGGLTYKGAAFKHFQQATAKVEYVLGEFYWRVETNDSCWVSDFVAPPLMLSSEKTDEDTTWSLGEYIEAAEIENAFRLPRKLPLRVGVYANQPSPYTESAKRAAWAALLFMGVALLIQIASLALSENKIVHEQSFSFSPMDAEKAVVTETFDVGGRRSNVVIQSTANVSNSWVFLNMALINDDSGTAYDLGREIGYYFGTDEDGAWSEGSPRDSVTIPGIPAGRYYLRVEPEGPIGANYTVRVVRDVPNWWPFILATILLLLAPAFALIRRLSFESRRWAESDHPWTPASNDDDDD